MILNDFLLIDELKHWRDHYTLDKPALRNAVQALGVEAAAYLKGVLPRATEQYPKVIVATHIPPFREAAWYDGRPSGDDYLPFFPARPWATRYWARHNGTRNARSLFSAVTPTAAVRFRWQRTCGS